MSTAHEICSSAVVDEIPALFARHLSGFQIRSIAKIGSGLDNIAYDVNGELIVRRSKAADPAERIEAAQREAALLAAVRTVSSLPVPEPLFADAETGFLAYRKVPGVPLHTHPVAHPALLAAPLGEFLNVLHRDSSTEAMAALVARDDDPPAVWLEGAGQDYAAVAGLLPAPPRRRIEHFLACTPPPASDTLVFCHNDLGSEHVLVDAESEVVTGVIDWTDAAIADPMHDLARLFRDLGPEFHGRLLTHYDHGVDEASRERMLFYARCSLIEDLAFGLSTGDRHYAAAARAHLDWTFG